MKTEQIKEMNHVFPRFVGEHEDVFLFDVDHGVNTYVPQCVIMSDRKRDARSKER